MHFLCILIDFLKVACISCKFLLISYKLHAFLEDSAGFLDNCNENLRFLMEFLAIHINFFNMHWNFSSGGLPAHLQEGSRPGRLGSVGQPRSPPMGMGTLPIGGGDR